MAFVVALAIVGCAPAHTHCVLPAQTFLDRPFPAKPCLRDCDRGFVHEGEDCVPEEDVGDQADD